MTGRAPTVMGDDRVRLRAEMRAAYEGGMTIHQVAERFGRSYGSTHVLLHEAQTVMRPRGGVGGRFGC